MPVKIVKTENGRQSCVYTMGDDTTGQHAQPFTQYTEDADGEKARNADLGSSGVTRAVNKALLVATEGKASGSKNKGKAKEKTGKASALDAMINEARKGNATFAAALKAQGIQF